MESILCCTEALYELDAAKKVMSRNVTSLTEHFSYVNTFSKFTERYIISQIVSRRTSNFKYHVNNAKINKPFWIAKF